MPVIRDIRIGKIKACASSGRPFTLLCSKIKRKRDHLS